MAGNNLKTKVTADTSDFKKGMKEAKDALKDFEKQGSSAISGLDSMLGGTSETISALAKNIKNVSVLFDKMEKDGSGALANLSTGAKLLGSALAGMGLTAVISGFKELNRSAELFRSTIEGTNLELQTKAYTDTFLMAMEDQLGNGARVAGTARWVKETGTRIGSTIGNMAVAAFDSIKPFENPAKGLVRLADNLQRVADASEASNQAGRNAKTYQGELNKALDDRLKKTNEWKDLQYEISKNERIAADIEASQADREQAIVNARKYQNQLFDEQISSAKEIYKWSALISEEAGDSKEDVEALVALEGNIKDLERAREESGRHLDKLATRVSKATADGASAAGKHASSVKETQEATALTLEAATKLVEKERQLAEINRQNAAAMAGARLRMDGALALPGASSSLQGQAQRLTMPAIIKPQIDTEAAQKAIVELSGIVESGVQGMSEALGDLVGNLINGENAWNSFAQAGISVVADMVSMVGQAFIKTGLGVIAAELALETGNGYAAVAAGAAMVAIAAAMKTTMSNAAANWGGGYSAPVASSAYTPGTSLGSYGREMEIKVTGTLTAEGSKLKAVLNNEDYRTSITT